MRRLIKVAEVVLPTAGMLGLAMGVLNVIVAMVLSIWMLISDSVTPIHIFAWDHVITAIVLVLVAASYPLAAKREWDTGHTVLETCIIVSVFASGFASYKGFLFNSYEGAITFVQIVLAAVGLFSAGHLSNELAKE